MHPHTEAHKHSVFAICHREKFPIHLIKVWELGCRCHILGNSLAADSQAVTMEKTVIKQLSHNNLQQIDEVRPKKLNKI